MKKHSILSAAIAASVILLANVSVGPVLAGPPPREAKVITADEAAKKYPPKNGKSYPPGVDAGVANDIGSATHSGFIKSPYSQRTYDCRKIAHGALVLDDGANQVFVRP